MPYEVIVDSERPNHGVGPGHLYASLLRSARYPRSSLRYFLVEARFWNSNTLTIPLILMESALASIQAFTDAAFTTPDKFSQFCENGGKALGGIIGGNDVSGSMNATFETTDPGSQEVLATVCEMGEAEIGLAVEAAQEVFRAWKDVSAEERVALVRRFVDLCDRDRDVLLACEVFDGSKVSELAEGDFTQIRECAEYFSGVAQRVAMDVAPDVKGLAYREPWGVVAGIIPWNYPVVLTSWFMFPALLEGNTILIKPVEDTPLSALYMAKLAAEAGFPPGVINVLPGRCGITGQ